MSYVRCSHCETQCYDRQTSPLGISEFCTGVIEHDMHIDLHTCNPRGPVIWGNVFDEKGKILEGCAVFLMRCEEGCAPRYSVIDQTRSDQNGCYELELPYHARGKYRIVVNCGTISEKTERKCQNCVCYF